MHILFFVVIIIIVIFIIIIIIIIIINVIIIVTIVIIIIVLASFSRWFYLSFFLFLLKSGRRRISSDLLDSTKYLIWFFNSVIVRMFSIFSLVSCSSNLFSRDLDDVPRTLITIFITVILMLRKFTLSGKIQVFVSLFAFFYFLSVVRWNNKIYYMTSYFLLVN